MTWGAAALHLSWHGGVRSTLQGGMKLSGFGYPANLGIRDGKCSEKFWKSEPNTWSLRKWCFIIQRGAQITPAVSLPEHIALLYLASYVSVNISYSCVKSKVNLRKFYLFQVRMFNVCCQQKKWILQSFETPVSPKQTACKDQHRIFWNFKTVDLKAFSSKDSISGNLFIYFYFFSLSNCRNPVYTITT